MEICTPPPLENNVLLDGQKLEQVHDFNYLGVCIDEKLNFEKQRNNTRNNANFRVIQLAKIRKYLDVHGALKLFKSKIMPIFDYADIIWDNHKNTFERELQLVHNRAMRIIYKVKLEEFPLYTTTQMQQMGKCVPLAQRRDMHLLFYAFDIKNDPASIDHRPRATRLGESLRYIQKVSKIPLIHNSFHQEAIRRWNKLKSDYTCLEKKDDFKAKIKANHPKCYINDRYTVHI